MSNGGGKRTMYFVDGENLVMRYQAMAANGQEPKENVIHEPDVFVWRDGVIGLSSARRPFDDIIRVTYYASCVGSDEDIAKVRQSIKKLTYRFRAGMPTVAGTDTATIYPRVFKKPKKAMKSRAVDINITIDILRHTFDDSVDRITLISGDGDFIPLAEEVMRKGKLFTVMALSSGLNPNIPDSVDDFYCLDSEFFQRRKQPQEATP